MKTALQFRIFASAWLLITLAAFHGSIAEDTKPTCYKLISVGTPFDDLNDADEATRKDAKDWTDKHTLNTEPDGTLIIGSKDRPSHLWRVNIKQARATAIDTGVNPKATIDATWTTPPAWWCSNDDITISMTSKGIGNMWGGPRLLQSPAERWDQSPNTTVDGKNPFGGVWSGQYSAGFVDASSGAITLRPKYKGGDQFITLTVNLMSNDNVYVHYRYQRTDEPKPAVQPGPPVQPPTPVTCTKTFAKSWPSTTWGVMAFTLDGNKASGTYSNRSGVFGPGTIAGTIAGQVLDGTWSDAKGTGTIKITLSDSGCDFDGAYTMAGGVPSAAPIGISGTVHPPAGTPTDNPGASAINLTGYWKSDAGALYYLRQMETKLYWSMNAMPSARNTFTGDIAGDTVAGTWIDLPGGTMNTGTLKIKIESNDKLTKISDSIPYGAGTWTRIAKPDVPGPSSGSVPPGTVTPAVLTPATGTEPYNTPAGRACIDAWITVAMAKLNAYDGGQAFNDRKPWGIDAKYGTLIGTKLSAALSPDEFGRYNYNPYWWIWDHYVKNADGLWDTPEWNKAGVLDLHAFAAKCP